MAIVSCNIFYYSDVSYLSIHAVNTFELTLPIYRATEDGETADVKISKNRGFTLANPVTFKITSLTVQQALDRGIIDSYPTPDDENVSPSRAGELIHISYVIII